MSSVPMRDEAMPVHGLYHLAYTIEEVCKATKMCKQSVYNSINSGRLRAKKIGARTLVLPADLRDFLNSLDDYVPAMEDRT